LNREKREFLGFDICCGFQFLINDILSSACVHLHASLPRSQQARAPASTAGAAVWPRVNKNLPHVL
jgi:hypothetical protein